MGQILESTSHRLDITSIAIALYCMASQKKVVADCKEVGKFDTPAVDLQIRDLLPTKLLFLFFLHHHRQSTSFLNLSSRTRIQASTMSFWNTNVLLHLRGR